MDVNNSRDNFETEGKLFNHIDAMYNDTKGFDHYWQNRRKLIVVSHMNQLFKEKNNISLLDIGCAEGLFTDTAIGIGYKLVVGIEISKLKLVKAHKNSKNKGNEIFYIQCSADKLPLTGTLFDIVLASRVLELVPDEKEVLRELNRISKQFCILTVPSVHTTLISLIRNKINPKSITINYYWGTQARLYSISKFKKYLNKEWKVHESFGIAPISFILNELSQNQIFKEKDDIFENMFLFRSFGHDIFYLLKKSRAQ